MSLARTAAYLNNVERRRWRRRQATTVSVESILAPYQALGATTAYYDWSKTDDAWQEVTGQTPADDPGEAIALKLDRSTWGGKTFAQVAAGQPEAATALASNNGTVTYVGGVATFVAAATNNGVIQTGLTPAGKVFEVTFRVVSITGSVRAYTGNGQGGLIRSAPGTYKQVMLAVGNGIGSIVAIGTTDAVVDQISFKEIPGNHAIQTEATGRRPTKQNTTAYDQVQIDAMPELANIGTQSIVNGTGSQNGAGFDVTATGNLAAVRQTGVWGVGKTYRVGVTWSGNDEARQVRVGLAGGFQVLTTAASGSASVMVVAGAVGQCDVFMNGSVAADTFHLEINSIKEVPASAIKTLPCARGDASDDQALTQFVPAAAGAWFHRITAGAAGATRMFLGGGTTNRAFFGKNTTGELRVGLGSKATSHGSDISGLTGVAVLTYDGSTYEVYWMPLGGSIALVGSSEAMAGTIGSDPLRLMASNAAGTPGNFDNSDHHQDIIVNGAKMSLADITAMANLLNAL